MVKHTQTNRRQFDRFFYKLLAVAKTPIPVMTNAYIKVSETTVQETYRYTFIYWNISDVSNDSFLNV